VPFSLLNKIKQFFVKGSIIHLRGEPISSTKEFVDFVDRFVDDKSLYDMEWDDFFSWTNANPQLEEIRNRLGEFEPLLSSRDIKNETNIAII
jgi:hypothetical protein